MTLMKYENIAANRVTRTSYAILWYILLIGMLLLVGCVQDTSQAEAKMQDVEKFPLQESSEPSEDVSKQHWNRIFTKAFEPVDCLEPRDPQSLPDSYYKGPMFDTHIHLLGLPGGEPGHPNDYYTGENLGIKHSMEEWKCMMNSESTPKALAFFPVAEPIIPESVDAVKKIIETYPDRFVLFINPPASDGSGLSTISAQELKSILDTYPGIFRGYGEIALYNHDDVEGLSPDSQRLTEIYPVVREHNLVVYFHMGSGQKEALKRVARANRNITFIFHGGNLYNVSPTQAGISHDEKILVDIEEILYSNPNVYYGIDELYGGDWLLEPGRTKQAFLDNFRNYGPLFEKDLSLWKGFIERHPNQVLWGTDRGGSALWDKDPDVAITLNNYTRAFIGKLDPKVQERFAYKNAERIFEDE